VGIQNTVKAWGRISLRKSRPHAKSRKGQFKDDLVYVNCKSIISLQPEEGETQGSLVPKKRIDIRRAKSREKKLVQKRAYVLKQKTMKLST